MPRPRQPVGKRIARLRAERGLTQRALAERAGCSHGYVCHLELGKRQATPQVLAQLARALDVPASTLATPAGDGVYVYVSREDLARAAECDCGLCSALAA